MTSLEAVLEDVEWGRTHRQDALWSRLSCPTLLLTAATPLGDERGFVVAPADRSRFLDTVPGSAVTSVVSVRRARYRTETPWAADQVLAYGRLAKTDPWDCGHAACGICHPRDFGRRALDAQLWRSDWEL